MQGFYSKMSFKRLFQSKLKLKRRSQGVSTFNTVKQPINKNLQSAFNTNGWGLSSKKQSLWLLSSLCLAACSFTPTYQVPQISDKPKDSWDKWTQNPWSQAKPSDHLDKGEWWKMFNDETLNSLELTLSKQSPSLTIALARYDQSTAYLKQAQALQAPSLDVAESTTQNRQSHNRPLRGSNQPDYYNAYTGVLGTNYELDFWGRVRGLVAAAKAQAQSSAADLQTERLSLQCKLAEVYFQLRGNDKQSLVLASTLKGYSKALELIKNRYEAGVASGIDLARAKAQLSTASAEISELNIQRAIYQHAIAVLIGETPQTFKISPIISPTPSPIAEQSSAQVTSPPIPVNQPPDNKTYPLGIDAYGRGAAANKTQGIALLSALPEIPTELPSTLLERRPDVAAAERRTVAANERIGVAKAAFYPNFYFGAAAGYQNTGGPAWLSEPNSFWSIGPAATFNLFDAGLRDAQLAQAKAALNQAGAEYRLVVLTAYQQVEDAMSRLSEYKTELNDRISASQASQQALQLAMQRYRDGAVAYLEVITAQTAALQAERSLIGLDTTELLTRIELIKALGGGWRKESLQAGAPWVDSLRENSLKVGQK
jgi:outer membrane protein TolC